MSDAVGPVFVDQKLSGDFQKSIDAEVESYTTMISYHSSLTSIIQQNIDPIGLIIHLCTFIAVTGRATAQGSL